LGKLFYGKVILMQESNNKILLKVNKLKKYYPIRRGLFYKTIGWIKAVDDVSFFIDKGKTLGLVGESGCGKTTLARVILRLIEPDEGSIYFSGQELTKVPLDEMRLLRKDLQIIFQDPFNSLDPRFTVMQIIQEGLLNFITKKNRKEVFELSAQILNDVGLPKDSLYRYPHEFSGGQRQRISIARSLILNPKLLILDEPVSSLDVSIQAQIINLLLRLQEKLGLTYLFISHDLNIIEYLSDRVVVMYLGKIMEIGNSSELYKYPSHTYTEALLSAVPVLETKERKKRILLRGEVPSPINMPSGCVFHTRCIYAKKRCAIEEPKLTQRDESFFACHFPL
jgi:oligopeptide/dipeptide ABC transporter ATP-binding protein